MLLLYRTGRAPCMWANMSLRNMGLTCAVLLEDHSGPSKGTVASFTADESIDAFS